MRTLFGIGLALALASGLTVGPAWADAVGGFADHRDIGSPGLPGSASYDPATRTYQVTAGGANMWAAHDDFHFAWKKGAGDVAIETSLSFVSPAPKPGAGGYLHRKGGVIIRQDLDPDSVYVDALRMGNRQLSLQYREVKGGPTRLIWINTGRQQALRLEKIGDYAYLYVPGADGKLHRAGGSFRLKLTGTYFIGLAVCPHDNTTRETMAFTDVRMSKPTSRRPAAAATIETIQVANPLEQTAILHGNAAEVTGWSADGESLYARLDGGDYKAVAWDSEIVTKVAASDSPSTAPSGSADSSSLVPGAIVARISPDGRSLAYLTAERTADRRIDRDVVLHVAPVADGKPAFAKDVILSKFRGSASSLGPNAWSPNSRMIAFVAAD